VLVFLVFLAGFQLLRPLECLYIVEFLERHRSAVLFEPSERPETQAVSILADNVDQNCRREKALVCKGSKHTVELQLINRLFFGLSLNKEHVSPLGGKIEQNRDSFNEVFKVLVVDED
jgi:hypothetical protein